jgi:hypothetical protein
MGSKRSCFISYSLSIFNPSQTFGLYDFGYPLLKKVDSTVEQQNNISHIIFYNYKIYDVWVECQTLGQHLYFRKILCVLYYVKVKVNTYSHQSNIAIYFVSLPLNWTIGVFYFNHGKGFIIIVIFMAIVKLVIFVYCYIPIK